MKRIFTFCVFMAAMVALFAKGGPSADMGDWNFKQFNFKKAALYYERALKRDKNNTYLLQRIADSYRLTNDWKAAEPYYARLSAINGSDPVNTLYHAQALCALQKYTEAKEYYLKSQELFPADSSIRERIKGLDNIEELKKDNGLYQIKNVEGVNSALADFGVTRHGSNEIYFCSSRRPDAYVRRVDNWTNGTFLELYVASIDSAGKGSNIQLLPGASVNKKFHEAAPAYNAKLNELYFDRSNYNGRRAFPSADKTVKLEIFKAGWSADQNAWNGEVKSVVPFNSKEYSVCHPSLNTAGDTLYFASDMPGGYGRADLYYCTRDGNGEWGTPRNMGMGVNTSGDDMFPFIADNGVLYFASNGHIGLGGLDIFYTKREAGKWSTPQNLGAPINTSADDFGLVMNADNKSGYLCSNRSGGAGDDDIYSFIKKSVIVNGITYNAYTGALLEGASVTANLHEVEKGQVITGADGAFSFNAEPGYCYTFNATKPEFYPAAKTSCISEKPELLRIPMYPMGDIKLQVVVIDKKTRNPLDSAVVKITNLHLSKSEVAITDKEGKCMFTLDTATDYRLQAEKETGMLNEKYLIVSDEISTRGVYPPVLLQDTLPLELVTIGVAIKLENIYYDLDKWFIRPDAAIELDRLVKILKDNPTINIELGSHTDCRAPKKYNMTLSAKRAQAAIEYIESRGIDMKRMQAAGYGESKLVNKCKCEGKDIVPCTEEQHQQNRRTEFKVLKF